MEVPHNGRILKKRIINPLVVNRRRRGSTVGVIVPLDKVFPDWSDAPGEAGGRGRDRLKEIAIFHRSDGGRVLLRAVQEHEDRAGRSHRAQDRPTSIASLAKITPD